ncbi:hypothetical protein [Ensifer sp.]|uniref:hypothetical protein n=1 Tax=Ensifer sp. TaxID=1872086 RepID=UPI0028A21477|nr:hypothetical protein [Ensifer sp.]
MSLSHHRDAIFPEQMTEVADIFSELLQQRGLSRSSEEAELLAARLLSLYQSGIHDREPLRQMAGFI